MKTPYVYQQAAINLGSQRHMLLADECGLGKTLVAIEVCRRALNTRQEAKVLIVVPKRAREQWVVAIEDQDPRPVKILEVSSTLALEPQTFYITHFEALVRLAPKLRHDLFDVVVTDEAHRIKNRNANRTKAVKDVLSLRRIALTGSPIEKSPGDLWSILNWLYPEQYSSYWKYCDRFVMYETIYTRDHKVRMPIGVLHGEELARKISPFTLHRTKAQVAPQLPPKIISPVPVPMDDAQAELYRRIEFSDDIIVDLEDMELDPQIIPTALSMIVRLQQVLSLPSLIDPKAGKIDAAKYSWLMEYLEDNPEEPVVVFCKFRETALTIARDLRGDACLLVGGSSWDDVKPFLEGRKRILVGTIAAMSESLNLQMARTAIFYDMEWSTILMQQAVDRIHRIDITEPKQVIYLLGGKVDLLIHNALERKWSTAELVFNYLKQRSNDSG